MIKNSTEKKRAANPIAALGSEDQIPDIFCLRDASRLEAAFQARLPGSKWIRM